MGHKHLEDGHHKNCMSIAAQTVGSGMSDKMYANTKSVHEKTTMLHKWRRNSKTHLIRYEDIVDINSTFLLKPSISLRIKCSQVYAYRKTSIKRLVPNKCRVSNKRRGFEARVLINAGSQINARVF